MAGAGQFFFVFAITAGAALVSMGALSPEWSTNGAGNSGLYSVCGCRNIDFDCDVATGVNGTREEFFTAKTECSEYSSTRVLAAITLGFVFIATVANIASEGYMYNYENIMNMDALSITGVLSLTAAFATGTVVVGLYLNTVLESGKNGLQGLDDGVILFVTGWAILAVPWALWALSIPFLSVRKMFGPGASGGMATSNFWTTASLILIAVAVMYPEWNKVLVREDMITPLDFQKVHNDMHAVIGANPNITRLHNITDSIITPPPETEKANDHLRLNPWGYCLCTDLKPNCKWQGASFFSGDKCDRFTSAQVFGWLTMAFALLTHIAMIFNNDKTIEGFASVTTFALLTGFFAIISTSIYGDLMAGVHGTKPDGAGFIMFIVGAFLVSFTGFVVGAWRTWSKYSETSGRYTAVGPDA